MSNLKQALNKIITAFPCVMIEQKNGNVYHLEHHWRYLNWKRDAKRVLIGEGKISNNRFEYLTEKFPTLKRTKF